MQGGLPGIVNKLASMVAELTAFALHILEQARIPHVSAAAHPPPIHAVTMFLLTEHLIH